MNYFTVYVCLFLGLPLADYKHISALILRNEFVGVICGQSHFCMIASLSKVCGV